MIKKSVFEEELVAGMHQQLIKQATQRDFDHLDQAAEYLNSAAEIFEDMGLTKNADQVLLILAKIAQKHLEDPHTKGLTPEKMVENLKHHGTEFNMSDAVSVPQPATFGDDYEKYERMLRHKNKKKLTLEDIDPDLAGLVSLDESDADDFLNLDINDTIEIADGKTTGITDFEDEID